MSHSMSILGTITHTMDGYRVIDRFNLHFQERCLEFRYVSTLPYFVK